MNWMATAQTGGWDGRVELQSLAGLFVFVFFVFFCHCAVFLYFCQRKYLNRKASWMAATQTAGMEWSSFSLQLVPPKTTYWTFDFCLQLVPPTNNRGLIELLTYGSNENYPPIVFFFYKQVTFWSDFAHFAVWPILDMAGSCNVTTTLLLVALMMVVNH